MGKSKRQLQQELTEANRALEEERQKNTNQSIMGYGLLGGLIISIITNIMVMKEMQKTQEVVIKQSTDIAKTTNDLVEAWNTCSNNLDVFNKAIQNNEGQDALVNAITQSINSQLNIVNNNVIRNAQTIDILSQSILQTKYPQYNMQPFVKR